MRRHVGHAFPDDGHRVGAAGAAALGAGRAAATMIHDHRDPGVAAAEANPVVDAEAAPMLARAGPAPLPPAFVQPPRGHLHNPPGPASPLSPSAVFSEIPTVEQPLLMPSPAGLPPYPPPEITYI